MLVNEGLEYSSKQSNEISFKSTTKLCQVHWSGLFTYYADEAACMKGREAVMYSCMAYENYHTMTLGIRCGARAAS